VDYRQRDELVWTREVGPHSSATGSPRRCRWLETLIPAGAPANTCWLAGCCKDRHGYGAKAWEPQMIRSPARTGPDRKPIEPTDEGRFHICGLMAASYSPIMPPPSMSARSWKEIKKFMERVFLRVQNFGFQYVHNPNAPDGMLYARSRRPAFMRCVWGRGSRDETARGPMPRR